MGVSFTLSPLNEVTELIKVTPLGSLPPQLARRVSVSGLTFVSPVTCWLLLILLQELSPPPLL